MELYIHIPFCRQKCRYCSFASFTGQEAHFGEYADLLIKEALLRRSEIVEPVRTVYIGGGTPSLLPPEILQRLITGIREIIGLEQADEFTSEANPGTVTKEWLESAACCGVNRLSFGMQAAQDSVLKLLGRIHRTEDVIQSVALARDAGFSNISLDLMFGIPTQAKGDWLSTLRQALSLRPQHISAYGLIPEEGTPLFGDLESGALRLPDPDEEREMYEDTVRLLAQEHFHKYEVSNFALDGFECAHNIGYWTQVPYLGLGVSAASMTGISYGKKGMTYLRRTNPQTMEAYARMILSGEAPEYEHISEQESRFETMMLGLRMNRGVSEKAFLEKHGVSVERCYGRKLRELEENKLVIHEDGAWRLSPRGFDIQNSVLVELMD